MNVYVGIGWWMVPLLVTIVACTWAHVMCKRHSSPSVGSGYFAGLDGLVYLLFWAPAIVVSLVAWLVYALAT